MYAYICICICMYIYVYIYTFMYTYMRICAYIYKYIYTHTYACTYTYTYTYIYIYICIHNIGGNALSAFPLVNTPSLYWLSFNENKLTSIALTGEGRLDVGLRNLHYLDVENNNINYIYKGIHCTYKYVYNVYIYIYMCVCTSY